MQIAIHLEGRPKDVAAFRLGGEIPIEVKITNATKLPFAYSRDALGRLNELSFVVTDAAGTVLPPAGRNPFPEATHGMLVVAPGTSLVTTELLGLSTKIRKPGSLVVKAELAIGGMAKTETMAVRSAPVELAITAASDQELDARIHALDKSFDAARSFDQRVAILRTLICIGRRDVAKSLVSSMYSFDHPMTIEAFRFLVELPKDFREFFMATVATRGLASGMRFFLSVIVPPATPDELYNIVQSALASGHDVAEQEGATLAVSYPDDRYTPKLIELASGPREVRWSAIRALAFNRSDTGVACLRRVLAQTDSSAQLAVTEAAKDAYSSHGKHRDGRRLKATDFPEVKESAVAAAPITVEARIDARLGAAMTIWNPMWKPLQFDGTHLVISSPARFKGKELIVFHDSLVAPTTSWPVDRDVRFELSAYYLDHELNLFEGAVSGLRVLERKR